MDRIVRTRRRAATLWIPLDARATRLSVTTMRSSLLASPHSPRRLDPLLCARLSWLITYALQFLSRGCRGFCSASAGIQAGINIGPWGIEADQRMAVAPPCRAGCTLTLQSLKWLEGCSAPIAEIGAISFRPAPETTPCTTVHFLRDHSSAKRILPACQRLIWPSCLRALFFSFRVGDGPVPQVAGEGRQEV